MLLADAQDAALGLALWFVAVMVVIMMAVVILLYVRRRLRYSANQENAGFTLEDLEGFKQRGDLSEDEYRALRRQILAAAGVSPAEKQG